MMRLRTAAERVPAGDHEPQTEVDRPLGIHQQRHQGRRHEGDGRLLPIDPGDNPVHLELVKEIVWRDQHRGTRGQRRPEIAHGDVESHVGRQGDPVLRGHPEAVVIDADQVGKRMVFNLNPLRLSGRSGGVDDVGPSCRIGGESRIFFRIQIKGGQFFVDHDHTLRGSGTAGDEIFPEQQESRFSIRKSESDTLIRGAGIHWDIRSSGFHHAERGDHEME